MTATEERGTAARVRAALRDAVETLPASVQRIAGYHLGWLDAHGAPDDAPVGKAIRPAFVLAAARAVDPAAAAPGSTGWDPVAGAVAVELVHDFSLLHDDVMDRDTTRRHRPTAWTVFGVGPAILAGDALVTLALDLLVDEPVAARMLAAAVQELVEGQLADVAFEQRADVTPEECQVMATGKTAALLGCSAALGALLGGGQPEQVRAFDEGGRELGLAFQIADDLLGIWGRAEVTGKPVGSDLQNRKKSFPVVAAMASGTEAGADLRALYALDRALSPTELVEAADLVERAGGRLWCRDRIDELVSRATRRIADSADGDPSDLLALAARAANRST